MSSYQRMALPGSSSATAELSLSVLASYVLDWIILIIVVVLAVVLGRIHPNRRPISLGDASISYPYTTSETVPNWLLVVLSALLPVIAIFLVALFVIPGGTVPRGTPRSLVWKRKLWELHVGWLGLLMSIGVSFFFVSFIKNMCGKPRPDLLSRCDPDLVNAADYRVGGFRGQPASAQLYSGDICRQADLAILNDGFRSYPSGHAAVAAAGLLYLSFYFATKFTVILPVASSSTASLDSSDAERLRIAFPSRSHSARDGYDTTRYRGGADPYLSNSPAKNQSADGSPRANGKMLPFRRRAAAPPIHLLAMTLIPWGIAIFISASRWFDYRHHGFDILFGFLMGTITAAYSFRFYQMPLATGAGWAWGPRTKARAFWAGLGRQGYGDGAPLHQLPVDERPDLGESGPVDAHPPTVTGFGPRPGQYPSGPQHDITEGAAPANGLFQDVEMNRLEHMRRPVAQPVGQAVHPPVG